MLRIGAGRHPVNTTDFVLPLGLANELSQDAFEDDGRREPHQEGDREPRPVVMGVAAQPIIQPRSKR